MLILGVDVSKASVIVCPLTEMPKKPRKAFLEVDFFKLPADKNGIDKLYELDPNVAILEPTGVKYSRLWQHHLEQIGCEVRMVDHARLGHYRKNHLRLTDKTDESDALALACYGWEYLGDKTRFNYPFPGLTLELRSLVLKLEQLNKLQSIVINPLRQDLAYQFPEVALTHSVRRKDKPAPLWCFLADREENTRYRTKLNESIGTGIQPSTKLNAERLCSIQTEEIDLENQITLLLEQEELAPYHSALEPFDFGLRTKAALIAHIYPFERFLGEDNKPIMEISRGRNSKRLTPKNISRRRFHKYLGVAPQERSSGDRKSRRVSGGSFLCRRALWRYVYTKIEVRKNRPSEGICFELGEFLDRKKSQGISSKKIKSIISSKIVKIIYSRLVKEIATHD